MTTYVVFQARHLIIGPEIVLFDAPATHQNERLVHLSGQTHNISRLWLNGRQIYTDAKGRFEEALILENGYTIATLRAEDRYGRETTVTREFVYTPASFIEWPDRTQCPTLTWKTITVYNLETFTT